MAEMKANEEHAWRLSKSGYSIHTGWGDDKRSICAYPSPTESPLNHDRFEQWMRDAEEICDAHNGATPPLSDEACDLILTQLGRAGHLHCSYDKYVGTMRDPVRALIRAAIGGAGDGNG